MSKEGDFTSQPGQMEKMKFFSTQFLDEAYFYLYTTVNKLSMWFWGMESPENSHGKSSQTKSHHLGYHDQPWVNQPQIFLMKK
jgi:hypothetical protein